MAMFPRPTLPSWLALAHCGHIMVKTKEGRCGVGRDTDRLDVEGLYHGDVAMMAPLATCPASGTTSSSPWSGEGLGFLGCAAMIALYAGVAIVGIAHRNLDPWTRILAGTLALPLISYGEKCCRASGEPLSFKPFGEPLRDPGQQLGLDGLTEQLAIGEHGPRAVGVSKD